MRVSTVVMFERSVSSMNRQQGEFMKVGEQLAAGKRVIRPSDDPQAAARAVGVSQSIAANSQHSDSRVTARNALSQEESVLNSTTDSLSRAKELLVQAGNGTLNDSARQSLATELRGVYESMIGQANSADGAGNYIFGGYQDGAAPFTRNATGNVEYAGGDQSRQQKVDSSRLMEVGNTGQDIFQRVAPGAGYVASAGTGNAGTTTFSGPQIADTAEDGYGDAFSVQFTAGDPRGYTVTNETTGQEVDAGDYESGQTLEFGGLRLTLRGEPEPGDRFDMAKAQDRDPDIFKSFEDMLAVLEKPIESSQDQAAYSNLLSTTSREMDNALDNVLTVRASVGARLNELDTLDSVGSDRALSYTQTKSNLVDLDYNAAISDYVLSQVGLQAAQKSFSNLQGTSLFDMI
ncbi:flagellar hook-associated protein FlgL [Salinicola aestuarinus]|uniref:flagellar hook-associated protein FlgL n=1 Tax=Salinicola aestuarinus TaxID=1949082 RepID=UPI000DA1426C|nr:flagellar hook-associated protein FlgL [Salinicola aestuarinus]